MPKTPLEKELNKFWLEQKKKGYLVDGSLDDYITVQDTAIHFVQWTIEQMKKDAVEVEVIVPVYEGDDKWCARVEIPGIKANVGDKVKLIILDDHGNNT